MIMVTKETAKQAET